MALPVGDEWTARPGVSNAGNECEPDPAPSQLADAAESAARYAVEGVGIHADPDRNHHPTRAAGAE